MIGVVWLTYPVHVQMAVGINKLRYRPPAPEAVSWPQAIVQQPKLLLN